MKYILEIYEPESEKELWKTFESDVPFLSFHKGDIIDPGTWEGSQSPNVVLEIVEIRHLIWSTDAEVSHKIMIYSKEKNLVRSGPRIWTV